MLLRALVGCGLIASGLGLAQGGPKPAKRPGGDVEFEKDAPSSLKLDEVFQRDDVPVFDANPYRKKYYDQFLLAKVRQRGVATATTREAVTAAPAPSGGAAAMKNPDAWRVFFEADAKYPLQYRELEDAVESYLVAAEREHARAALFMAAGFACVPLDARLTAFAAFARCGCPNALHTFFASAPVLWVEGPLLLAAASFAARGASIFAAKPTSRQRAPAAAAVDDVPMRRARKLAMGAELFQGRLAMVFAAACVLLIDPATYTTPPMGAL